VSKQQKLLQALQEVSVLTSSINFHPLPSGLMKAEAKLCGDKNGKKSK